MNKPDLFEEHIKKAVENYEAPFDASAWEKIENQLPANSTTGLNSIKNWVIGAVAVAAVASGFWYFTKSTSPDIIEQDKQNTEQIKEDDSRNDGNLTKGLGDESEKADTLLVDEKGNKINADSNRSMTKLEKAKAFENTNLIPDQENGYISPIISDRKNQSDKNSLKESDENLIVNWIISSDELCQGEELMVSIDNVNEPVELIWDFGDGITSNDPKVYHKYETPGVYTIKLKANSLISDNKIYREKKYIEVKANPQSNFVIEKSENMEMLPEVSFTNSTKYFNHIEWVFNDDTIDEKKSVKKLYRYKGLYHIGLYVTNQYGCRDSIYKDLVIENDYNLMAPDAFTPNEDGMNDYFIPKALMFLKKKFTMQVISKNGRVVFETKNVESPWNGKLNNSGALLENGPYAWTVKLEDGSVYSGTVILMIE